MNVSQTANVYFIVSFVKCLQMDEYTGADNNINEIILMHATKQNARSSRERENENEQAGERKFHTDVYVDRR